MIFSKGHALVAQLDRARDFYPGVGGSNPSGGAMRFDWDDKLKLTQGEKLMRIIHCHTGRKHQHRPGNNHVSNEQRRRRKHNAAISKAKRAKFLDAMRAYWSGELDQHPTR